MDLSSSSLGSYGNNNSFSPQSNAGGKIDANQKAQLIATLKHQLMVAKLEQLLETTTTKCFKMCVTKPSSSLSNSEQVK